MFSRITNVSLGLFFGIAIMWGLSFGRAHERDYAACRLIKEQEEAASKKSLATTTHQNRKGVVKEIYFSQEDNTRLHYRIESDSSSLTLKPDGRKLDLIEKLEKIKCWMQDKLYIAAPGPKPMQQMRFLEAEDGIYRYASQQFLAQSVGLSLFRLPGHDLPDGLNREIPFMRGVAQDVSFSVSGKTPQFNALHFKALLSNQTQESK
jgi:hypothetical protein